MGFFQVRQGFRCGRSLQLSAAQPALSAEAPGGAAGARGGRAQLVMIGDGWMVDTVGFQGG